MQADSHQPICQMIDKSLIGMASPEEKQTLRNHLLTCNPCKEYLDASQRVIAGLGGFSFEMDPGLNEKVLASLALRQVEAKRTPPMPIWWSRLVGLFLTVAGSFAASRFANLAAAVLHVQPAQMRFGLIAFWIAPSVGCCLLLLILSVSPASGMNRKGLSL